MSTLRRFGRNGAKVQLQSPMGSGSDFVVTAIGSCRIMGPLRHLEAEQKITLNQTGVYGYSHSSGEVRRHIGHLLNRTSPPKELLPLLAPSNNTSEDRSVASANSDYYVFELSSAKEVSIDGHPVQLNYFKRHFSNFFSDLYRTRAFWLTAKRRNPTEMKDFLSGIPEFRRLPETSQSLLCKTELSLTTADKLKADIDAIRLSVADHLFVTHFGAVTPAGSQLQARAEYLEMLRTALSEVGANWFDPTQTVAKFGQSSAIDQSNNSLSHYTPAFEKRLGQLLWQNHLNPTRHEQRLDAELRHRIKANARERAKDMQPAT